MATSNFGYKYIVAGFSEEKNCLRICSTRPPEDFEQGGSQWGYQREWFMNHYTFSQSDRKHLCEALNLTEDQLMYWDQFFTVRYNPETDEWYTTT